MAPAPADSPKRQTSEALPPKAAMFPGQAVKFWIPHCFERDVTSLLKCLVYK